MANWNGQTVMLITASGIVPAITTAHYVDGIQEDVSATEADTVDLVTLGGNSSRFTNISRRNAPLNFEDRLTATQNEYFVSGGVVSDNVTEIISLTQEEYDALTPDESTLYVIVG